MSFLPVVFNDKAATQPQPTYTRPFNFLGLPRELRDLFYEILINSYKDTPLEGNEGDMLSPFVMYHTLRGPGLAPKLVCKQVREEYEKVVFRETRHIVVSHNGNGSHSFRLPPPVHQFSFIRHLEIDIIVKRQADIDVLFPHEGPGPHRQGSLLWECPNLRTMSIVAMYDCSKLVGGQINITPVRESSILTFSLTLKVRLGCVFFNILKTVIARPRWEAAFEAVEENRYRDLKFFIAVRRVLFKDLVVTSRSLHDLWPQVDMITCLKLILNGHDMPKLTVQEQRQRIAAADMLYQLWRAAGRPSHGTRKPVVIDLIYKAVL